MRDDLLLQTISMYVWYIECLCDSYFIFIRYAEQKHFHMKNEVFISLISQLFVFNCGSIIIYYSNYSFLFNYLLFKHKYSAMLFLTLTNIYIYIFRAYIFIVRRYCIYQRIPACYTGIWFFSFAISLPRSHASPLLVIQDCILLHEWCQVERRAYSSPDSSYAS